MIAISQLEVTNLHNDAPVVTVARVDLEVSVGQSVAIVGGADSGKRELLMATLALGVGRTRLAGSVRYHAQELLGASARVLEKIRGDRIALLPQDARSALDPSRPVGEQLREVLHAHRKLPAPAATERIMTVLRTVQLAEPEVCLCRYVRDLSPAACQRVALAMAISCEPELLLLDEPTATLEGMARCDLLSLLCELRERGLAMLITTADFAVAAALADRVAVMYGGRVIEQGTVLEVIEHPRHPYTLALLNLQSAAAPARADREVVVAMPPPLSPEASRGCAYAPHCSRRLPECITSVPALTGTDVHASACWQPVEEVEALLSPVVATVESGEAQTTGSEWLMEVKALVASDATGLEVLRGVSFGLGKGQTLGVVGESGSGATLIPRVLLQLVAASAGEVLFHGEDLCDLDPEELRLQRQYLQGIGPAPLASIDPLLPMLDVIEEPLRIFRPQMPAIERRERVYSMLGAVGLQPRHLGRFAHEISREEALRVALARALILKPDVLVWTEPWSGLDSARAACSQLLRELRASLRFAVLLVVRDWRDLLGQCERVLVLYGGTVVETGACEDVYGDPVHPFTRALLEATPLDPLRACRSSSAPTAVTLMDRPAPALGCAFRECCPYAIARCESQTPLLQPRGARFVACHRAGEM